MDSLTILKLKELRKESKITQEQLAEKLDISRSKVSSWETKGRDMSIGEAVELSRLYKTSLDEMFNISTISSRQYIEVSNKFIKNRSIPLNEKVEIIEKLRECLKKDNIDEFYEEYKMTQNATK